MGLILSPIILLQFGWRALFLTFGLLGAPLLAMWLATVPNKASQSSLQQQQQGDSRSSSSRRAEGALQPQAAAAAGGGEEKAAASIGDFLKHRATWAIILVNFVNHWGYFIYLNWMPTYFFKVGATGVLFFRKHVNVLQGCFFLDNMLVCESRQRGV